MIRIDSTPSTHVIACACGWRSLQLTRAAAWTAAAGHEAACHPGHRHAQKMAAQHSSGS